MGCAVGGCRRERPSVPSAPWSPTIERIASPAGDGSAQPQLTTSDTGVVLSWLESVNGSTTLKFSERTDRGWSDAQVVVSRRDLLTNWADVPSVTRLSSGTLVAHWLQETDPRAEAYDLRISTSDDQGRNWSSAVTPHHDDTKSQHGFASIYEIRRGGFGVLWLDGRSKDTSLRAAIFDRTGEQQIEDALVPRVCDCCPTSTAVTSDGAIVAFRGRSDDETRDILISRFVDDGWTEPAAVHHDGWRIDACPVNGPAISASGRRVAVAWFTAADDRSRAFVAFSDDAGKTFSPPIRVDDATALGRVDVEQLADGSAIVGWIEAAGNKTAYQVRRIDRAGARSPAAVVVDISGHRSDSYPRMARRGTQLIFAWSDSATLRVQTAVAKAP
jgi:hypothetical protein